MISKEYKPISCNFYDILESLATYGTISTIVYHNDLGKELTIKTKIVDLFTKNKEEFMKLESGQVIRLDKLVRVNEISLEGFYC